MSIYQPIDMDMALQVSELLDDARCASRAAARRVEVLSQGAGFVLRQITLMTGEELPFRRNTTMQKHWRVVSGVGHADVDETEIALMPSAELSIAPGALHQIENRASDPLVLEELRVAAGLRGRALLAARRSLARGLVG